MTEWNPQANELFLEALERPAGSVRTYFLQQACHDDESLQAQVIALLEANDRSADFLSAPVEELRHAGLDALCSECPGTVIGPYKLLQEIGEGGMGVVYMAEQSRPVRRTVALKIIKPGMDTRQVVARFEAEREALALMDHPNIARVLDAGTTAPADDGFPGRPFFVMELVKGVPITKYCDERQMTPRQRLELFIPVCKAVQHAHQKGVIHRDLKPSNVIVAQYDGQPVPKIIDFGVAKATGPKLTEQTLFTEFGAVVGTLEYMSPEQAELNQLDVDTRSDIYSLGVLLYELLTGTTPLQRSQTRDSSIMELLRMIREEQPQRPSTRLSTADELPLIAASRGVDPKKLSGLIRGDLDWIVMKALEKDRNRRYETATALAGDIERYLNHCGVEARPPSAIYRFQKFARRNRLMLTAVILVSATLIIGTIVSAALAVRAMRAMRLAEAASADAEHRRIEAEQARAAEAVQRKLAEDARNAAEKRRSQSEKGFRDSRNAIDAYFESLRANKQLNVPALQPLRKELLGSALAYYGQFVDQHDNDSAHETDLAYAYDSIGELNRAIGSNQQAIDAFQQAIQRYEPLAHKNPAYFWHVSYAYEQLAYQQRAMGQLEGAQVSLTRALANWQNAAQKYPHDRDYQTKVASAYVRLGNHQSDSEQFVEAEASFRQAFQIFERLQSEEPIPSLFRTYVAEAHYCFGSFQRATGRLADAEVSYRQAIQNYEQLASENQTEPSHLAGIAGTVYQLGHVQRIAGHFDAAEQSYTRAMELHQALSSKDPSYANYRRWIGGARFHLGLLESIAGRKDAAIQSWNTALAEFDAAAALGCESPGFFAGQADTLAMLGRWREAADVLTKAVDSGDSNWRYRYQLALLHWAGGDEERYRAACHDLVARRAEQAAGAEAGAIVLACLVSPKAIDNWNDVLAIAERAAAADPSNPVCQALVGAAQYRAGQIEQAQRSLEQTLPLFIAADSSTSPLLDAVRASRVLGETMLMLVYRERGDEGGLARQARSVQELVKKLSSTGPVYCDEGDSWRIGFAVLFTERELARHEASVAR